jgi:YVTN family beta-propeller protein
VVGIWAKGSSSRVTPIRTATNTAGKAIAVGKDPVAIAITPNGKTAYVANAGSGNGPSDTVTPIRTATDKAGKAITVGGYGAFPGAIAITPNGKTAYVTNVGSGTVIPVRTATNKAGKAIKVGSDPVAIAITAWRSGR